MSARHALARPETVPLDLALSVIPSLPRALLARLVERAIECLDEMDGDPDVELNGDENDRSGSEDDFDPLHATDIYMAAGCPIADPGEMGCRTLPRPTYDGEDQTIVILPAPAGIEPYRFRVS